MEENFVMKGGTIQLHGVIITHPDNDHLSGIKKLLEKYGQKIKQYDIVLTRAFYYLPTTKVQSSLN